MRLLRMWLSVCVFPFLPISEQAQPLSITSLLRTTNQTILKLSSTASGIFWVDVSSDLKSWTELSSAVPDGGPFLKLPLAADPAKFYRVYSGDNPTTLIVARSTSGNLLTNATVAIEPSLATYSLGSNSMVKLPQRLFPRTFSVSLQISAPGLETRSVQISPSDEFVLAALSDGTESGNFPPAKLVGITFAVAQGGVTPGSRYWMVFNGATAGTFASGISSADWSGTFSYEPGAMNFSHLRADYGGVIAGDFDDITLAFSSLKDGTFSGSQRVNGTIYPFSGSFILP